MTVENPPRNPDEPKKEDPLLGDRWILPPQEEKPRVDEAASRAKDAADIEATRDSAMKAYGETAEKAVRVAAGWTVDAAGTARRVFVDAAGVAGKFAKETPGKITEVVKGEVVEAGREASDFSVGAAEVARGAAKEVKKSVEGIVGDARSAAKSMGEAFNSTGEKAPKPDESQEVDPLLRDRWVSPEDRGTGGHQKGDAGKEFRAKAAEVAGAAGRAVVNAEGRVLDAVEDTFKKAPGAIDAGAKKVEKVYEGAKGAVAGAARDIKGGAPEMAGMFKDALGTAARGTGEGLADLGRGAAGAANEAMDAAERAAGRVGRSAKENAVDLGKGAVEMARGAGRSVVGGFKNIPEALDLKGAKETVKGWRRFWPFGKKSESATPEKSEGELRATAGMIREPKGREANPDKKNLSPQELGAILAEGRQKLEEINKRKAAEDMVERRKKAVQGLVDLAAAREKAVENEGKLRVEKERARMEKEAAYQKSKKEIIASKEAERARKEAENAKNIDATAERLAKEDLARENAKSPKSPRLLKRFGGWVAGFFRRKQEAEAPKQEKPKAKEELTEVEALKRLSLKEFGPLEKAKAYRRLEGRRLGDRVDAVVKRELKIEADQKKTPPRIILKGVAEIEEYKQKVIKNFIRKSDGSISDRELQRMMSSGVKKGWFGRRVPLEETEIGKAAIGHANKIVENGKKELRDKKAAIAGRLIERAINKEVIRLRPRGMTEEEFRRVEDERRNMKAVAPAKTVVLGGVPKVPVPERASGGKPGTNDEKKGEDVQKEGPKGRIIIPPSYGRPRTEKEIKEMGKIRKEAEAGIKEINDKKEAQKAYQDRMKELVKRQKAGDLLSATEIASLGAYKAEEERKKQHRKRLPKEKEVKSSAEKKEAESRKRFVSLDEKGVEEIRKSKWKTRFVLPQDTIKILNEHRNIVSVKEGKDLTDEEWNKLMGARQFVNALVKRFREDPNEAGGAFAYLQIQRERRANESENEVPINKLETIQAGTVNGGRKKKK